MKRGITSVMVCAMMFVTVFAVTVPTNVRADPFLSTTTFGSSPYTCPEGGDYEPFRDKGLFSFISTECDHTVTNPYFTRQGSGHAAVYWNALYTPMVVAEASAYHSGCNPPECLDWPSWAYHGGGGGTAEHEFSYKSVRNDGQSVNPYLSIPVIVKYQVGINVRGSTGGSGYIWLMAGSGGGYHQVASQHHEQNYIGVIATALPGYYANSIYVKIRASASAWATGAGGESQSSHALTIVDPYVYIDPESPLADEMQILIYDYGTNTYVPQIYLNIFNEPPIADANGPYETTEGSAITFDASASTDPDEDELQYRWDFDDDGMWDTDWSSDPTAMHTWYDDHAGTAVVEVSDGEETDTATVDVTVNNVPPVAAINGMTQPFPAFIMPTDELSFAGSFTDPGTDTHTVEWSFGDGTTAIDTLSPTHAYESVGDYTVTLTVTDDNGGTDTATYPVTVKTPKESIGVIDEYIESQKLPKGVKDSLQSILDAAIISLDNGQTNAAVNQLVAFMYLVEALRDVKLSNVQADTLQSEAQWIIDYLSG